MTTHMNAAHKLAIPMALFLFSFLCYWMVIPTYFLADDFQLIGRVAREGMFWTWGSSRGGFLRPGTILAYLMDYRIWGFNPVGYHLTNIAWHAAAAYALYLVARALLHEADDRDRRRLSFLAACLFIALPCHSESVAWIAGRTDVIAVALGLGATATFLHVLSSGSVAASFCALLFLAGALLAKESVIPLPAIWLLMTAHRWWCSKTRPPHLTLVTLALAFLIWVGYFFLRKITLGHFIGGYATERHTSMMTLSTMVHLGRYAIRTFIPALPLRFYEAASMFIVFGVCLLLGVVAAMLRFRFKALKTTPWHLLPLLALSFIGSLIPVATMNVGMFDTQSERFLYLPSAFACIGAAVLIDILFRPRKVANVILLSLIVIQSFALQWGNTRWKTASILSRQIAAEVSEHSPENTVILNVPDNYRGAYVFRNGLQEAATLFVGNNTTGSYLVICKHSLDSLQQNVDVIATASNLIVTLPDALRFYNVRPKPYEARLAERSLFLSDANPSLTRRGGVTVLSFKNGMDRPMLRAIAWNPPNALRERVAF
jgi:hypothetical protein